MSSDVNVCILNSPTAFPTQKPTKDPTTFPTQRPTKDPTQFPSSRSPTAFPSNHPTNYPTQNPEICYYSDQFGNIRTSGPLGAWNHCNPQCPCDIGEGDCDTNLDCKDGLVCKNNIGDQYLSLIHI